MIGCSDLNDYLWDLQTFQVQSQSTRYIAPGVLRQFLALLESSCPRQGIFHRPSYLVFLLADHESLRPQLEETAARLGAEANMGVRVPDLSSSIGCGDRS